MLADLVDGDDAGVFQRRDGLGLVLEPAELGIVGQDTGLDHLEGDGAVEAELAGPVDDAHAAFAQGTPQLVVAEVADAGAAGQLGAVAVAVGRRQGQLGGPVHRRELGRRARQPGPIQRPLGLRRVGRPVEGLGRVAHAARGRRPQRAE
jgi:hypothetical protein